MNEMNLFYKREKRGKGRSQEVPEVPAEGA